jgi:hypothetical protein
VFLRSGEVLQRRAERFGRHDPQVDLQAARQPDRHLRIASDQHVRRPGKFGETVHDPVDFRCDDQHVQVAHRLASAAVAAGEFELLDAFAAAQVSAQLGDDLVRLGPVDPLPGCGRQGNPAQDRRLGFRPEALQRADAAFFASPFQIVQRGDSQFVVHRRRLLRTHPRNPHDGQDTFGNLVLQFLQLRQFAGPHQDFALLGHRLADAVDSNKRFGSSSTIDDTDSGRFRMARAPLR